MVSVAATVVMASTDSSGNGRAGNGGRNRGSGGTTTINQNVAAAVAKIMVVVAAAAAVAKVQRQGQIVLLITLEGVLFHVGSKLATDNNILAIFWWRIRTGPKKGRIEVPGGRFICATNKKLIHK